MNIIKKIIKYIKSIFIKQEEVKLIEAPKEDINNKKAKFLETIKVNVIEKRKKMEIETLICEGDGLGIQKKLKF
ncbi:MAG: hypothetical protein HFJ48_02245 [Clostridia bacterium]|nr:hypothetical protein [Clostridia bacterium]